MEGGRARGKSNFRSCKSSERQIYKPRVYVPRQKEWLKIGDKSEGQEPEEKFT